MLFKILFMILRLYAVRALAPVQMTSSDHVTTVYLPCWMEKYGRSVRVEYRFTDEVIIGKAPMVYWCNNSDFMFLTFSCMNP